MVDFCFIRARLFQWTLDMPSSISRAFLYSLLGGSFLESWLLFMEEEEEEDSIEAAMATA